MNNNSFFLILLSVLFGMSGALGQPIVMTNTHVIQDIGEDVYYFYDPGGPITPEDSGNFGLGIRDTLTMRNVVTGPGRLIVEFVDFAMGYGDTLYVFDGQDCNGMPIGFYHSVYSPEQISTTAGFLTFVFHSDSVNDSGILKSGWMAKAYVIPSIPEEFSLDTVQTVFSTCNGKFYDSGGPTGNMTADTGISWCNISSPVSHVKLEFDYFEVNGVMKIYDGNYNDPERRLIGQFHSTTVDPTIGNKPPVLFSSGTTLSVEYISASGDMSRRGWSATVSCVPELFESLEGSACPRVFAEDEFGVEMPDTIHHICGMPVILSAHVTATGQYTNDYTVRQIPFNPPYPFTAGTNLIHTPISSFSNHDDEWWAPISLGFTFSFFGKDYTTVYPGENAIISFDPRSGSCNWTYGTPPASPPYTNIPGNQTQGHPYNYANAIYGVYHDVHCGHFSDHGNVRTGVFGIFPCRSFVLNYDHIALFGHSSSSSYGDNETDNGYYNTYQMVMYEGTNIIDVYVKHCSKGQTATNITPPGVEGIIGLQNKSSSQILLAPGRGVGWWVDPGNPEDENIKKNQANDEAWRFTPITPMDEDATITWFADTISESTCIGYTKKLVVNPQQSTKYIVKYQFTNSAGNMFQLYDTVRVVVDAPVLRVVSRTQNSAVLDWTQEGTYDSWTIHYKKESDNAWNTVENVTHHPYTINGLEFGAIYQVYVTANNGSTICSISNTETFVADPDGVNEYVNSTVLYPNPTTGQFTISNEQCTIENVEVYDVYGKVLNNVMVNDNKAVLDVTGYASGIYFARIHTDKGVVVKQIVKK